ncbi:MAG: hypothetical protein L6367_14020 [Cellulomonas sp.]|nr:hypothetical protein [Cellulomonas sp.]
MVTYVGMEPLIEGDGSLAIRVDEGMIDLRARYAVIDVQVDLRDAEVRFSLFGEGRATLLSLGGVTEIYSPPARGGEPFTFFTDQSLMTRPDTLSVTHPKGASDGSRWFTVETDGGLSLAARASRVTYSVHGADGAGAKLPLGLTYARIREWPASRRDERDPGADAPAGVDPAPHDRLDLVEIDLVNGIVRLVVAGPGSRRILRFEDVKDIRTEPGDGRDLHARIAELEGAASITRLGPVVARSGAPDQWYEVVTRGGFEIAVRAGRVEEARLPPLPSE